MLLDIRLLTIEDYQRMAEAEIFHPEERVELIAGQVIKMSAKGTAHAAAVKRTEKVLETRLGEQVWVRTQDPICLDDYSQPEPDVAVVRVDPLDYADHHPIPSEIYLIIEVADTSLRYDCETKRRIYAQAQIADYWVLDVNTRQLHVYRQPVENSYESVVILSEDASISPVAFPDVTISIRQMLPPA